MGRPAKGVRHWYDKQQKRYFIRDGKLKISLGFGREAENHLERADLEVARYIAERQAVAQQKLKKPGSRRCYRRGRHFPLYGAEVRELAAEFRCAAVPPQ